MSDLVQRLREYSNWGISRKAAATMSEAADEIESLTRELEAARKDAERYRWLRARPLDDDEIYIAVDSHRHVGRWGLGGDDPDGCDAAIDAAISQEK